MRESFIKPFVVFILLLVSGCSVPASQPPTATIDQQIVAQTVSAVQTQVASTMMAQFTQQALLTPAATQIPSLTVTNTSAPPSDTPTSAPTSSPTFPPTITLTPVPPTPLPTLTRTIGPYQCLVVSQSPKLMAEFGPGADFDGNWTLKNTGTKTWSKDEIDFRYISGDKLQKYTNITDLSKDVAPGKEIKIIIDMRAPKQPGTYTSNWALAQGSYTFCVVTIQIKVTK